MEICRQDRAGAGRCRRMTPTYGTATPAKSFCCALFLPIIPRWSAASPVIQSIEFFNKPHVTYFNSTLIWGRGRKVKWSAYSCMMCMHEVVWMYILHTGSELRWWSSILPETQENRKKEKGCAQGKTATSTFHVYTTSGKLNCRSQLMWSVPWSAESYNIIIQILMINQTVATW